MSSEEAIHSSSVLAVGPLFELIRSKLQESQPMMTSPGRKHVCWICGRIVPLEECKVDEHGLPVHEDCYVVLLLWRKDLVPQKSA